jgi:hypothetical protein
LALGLVGFAFAILQVLVIDVFDSGLGEPQLQSLAKADMLAIPIRRRPVIFQRQMLRPTHETRGTRSRQTEQLVIGRVDHQHWLDV